jgi:hypothetical protein
MLKAHPYRRIQMKKVLFSIVCSVIIAGTFCASGNTMTLESKELGVSFHVPAQNEFHPGDIFYMSIMINNPTQETFHNIPLFLVFWTGDEQDFSSDHVYYCPPPSNPGDWHAGDIYYYSIDVPPGITEMEIAPVITWPFTPGYSDTKYAGLAQVNFLTQMADPIFTNVFGSGDVFSFKMY